MRKTVIAVALMLFACCGIVSAQQCTPVRLGTDSNYNSASGPNIVLGFGTTQVPWRQYNKGATIYTTPEGAEVGTNRIWGYIDIFGLYGGCLEGWGYEMNGHWQLTDVTPGSTRVVLTEPTPQYGETWCGRVSSCAFNLYDPNYNPQHPVPVTLESGHTYHFIEYVFAFIPEIPATSNVYSAYITIEVQ